jgi:Ca2+-binding RTX toxin-like protein
MAKPLPPKGSPTAGTRPRLPSRAFPAAAPVEQLEARRLCSVTVTQGWTGYYTIEGTPAADNINVSVNRSAGTFTVEGTTYTGVQYINVIGGDGNDNIRVEGDGSSGSVAASISGGAGNDFIWLNFDGAIWGGDGDDGIYLFDAFRGQVLGEAGDDFISVIGNCIEAVINAGPGDDGIDASHNNSGVVADGGPGDDALIGSPYNDELHGGEGNDDICGEGGDDIIYAQDSGGVDSIWGGSGHDTLYANMSDIIMDGSVEVIYRG